MTDASKFPPRYDLKDLREAFSVCILGASGAGKTRMAIASLPPEARVAILITEHGLASVRNELRERRETYRVFEVTKSEQVREMAEHIRANPDKADYVVLDSLNELAGMIVAECDAKYKGSIRLWQEAYGRTMLMIRLFKAIPRIFVCTCLEDVELTENGPVVTPLVDGKKLKKNILAPFDEVYLLKSFALGDGPRIWAVTNGSGGYPCKNRNYRLDYYEPPDLTAIIKKMLGYAPGLKE